jgi:3'-phosphoadenosine 5'-phosphosulfate sulfotransferase (PAPS reductase)/FAD synthetase
MTKHIVGFSGGIDSQACARWVLNHHPSEDVILLNSDAGGNEHPLTTEFVRWYSENVHPVVVIQPVIADMWKTEDFAATKGLDGNALLTFDLMAVMKKRFPSRVAQFCTEILKIRPQQRWVRQMFGPEGQWAGEEYLRYTGVRRDESEGRKDTPFVRWDEYYDCEVHAPICDWTKQQCFDYVKAHGEQVNPLYAMGFNRVGCAPCVNSGKQDILNWATRFPEMIDKIRDWETRLREAVPHAKGNFFQPNIIPGKTSVLVDEVVEWARTGRGGRQQMFPIFHEREACESKYGLCE